VGDDWATVIESPADHANDPGHRGRRQLKTPYVSSAGPAAPPKVELRLPANLAGGIYGTILATALVAGLSESHSSSARALGILLGTGAIVWAAHVYASLLANRLERQRRLSRAEVRCVAARDWPLFQSSVPLAIPLAIGWLGIFSRDTALSLATLVGVATLMAWGIGLARSEGRGVSGTVFAVTMNAAVGLFIVALKVAIR
jgi:uncharacterized membrane protein